MAFQAVPDVAEVVMRFAGVPAGDVSGCEAEVAFYVRDESTEWDATQLARLADYYVDWFDDGKGADPAADSITDDGWVLTQVIARDLANEGGISVLRSPNLTGQRSGVVVPPTCTMLIQYQLDAGSPPSRGWVHWPGGVEADLDGDDWTLAFIAECQNVFDGMDENLSNAGEGGFATWAQVRISRNAGTDAQLAAIRGLREDLREAIAATRRNAGLSNTLGAPIVPRRLIGSQRDRRRD